MHNQAPGLFSDVLFFFRHIWVSSEYFCSPSSMSRALWTTQSLLLHTEWRGRNKTEKVSQSLLGAGLSMDCKWRWTVLKCWYRVCIYPVEPLGTWMYVPCCVASPACSECILKKPLSVMTPLWTDWKCNTFQAPVFNEKCSCHTCVSHWGVLSLFFMELEYGLCY